MTDIATEIERLKSRLRMPLPGQAAQSNMASRQRRLELNAPADARPSAVLGLFFPVEGALNILFIKRVEDGKTHGGQISFPGGKRDQEDIDLQATALREANEEVGIEANDVEIIGALSTLYIPVSNFNVYPYLGYMPYKPDYIINHYEVDRVLEIPISHLWHDSTKITTTITPSSYPQMKLTVPAYQVNDNDIIWGATAMILAELETVMAEL